MKWVRISLMLLAVLAAMRLGSWAVGWILAKLAPFRAKLLAIVANVLAFGAFTWLLVRDRLAGEPLDWAALWFGLVVFAICCWIDFYWRPWRVRE